MSPATLIVGASQAGVQLAVSLREAGETGPVMLVGAEPHPPYQRPPLSKAFLLGGTDTAKLAFRTPAFYAERSIELITGERVERLALRPGTAEGSATTSTGRTLAFDQVALTTGARVRRLAVPGADLAGVHHLRDMADAVLLRAALDAARRVVVVGGGFIGLEAAAVARTLGKDVVIVEASDRLVGRSVAPTVSDFYRSAHERRGTAVLLGSAVARVLGDAGRVSAVGLTDGTELPADLVLVGIGVVPRTELAEAIGLHCDGGVVVDRHARTGNAGIVAAGDCTAMPHPTTGVGLVRLESVANAVSQAKTAAATLAGIPPPAPEVPWFWSDQYDLKLQIAGLSTGHDESVVRGDLDAERFSVLYYRNGAVVAVDAVNSPVDYLVVRKALGTGAAIPPDLARDTGRPLKELLVPAGPNRGTHTLDL
ncbi:NAD(P)/FAD-dependent oxidoreductase [Pseudonocardia spinosispora]|uniref:NAD(P)/FAD-dependent oxidoreductase n=1 Tax=Pseudonocardia spinosispora TaxID=103441 RepID=UPI0004281ACD|nr:FAD-dependent oxidoreductase [Pseudonocardia spinosispora]